MNTPSNAAPALAPTSRLPIPVMLVWLCAFSGLALYAASWIFPGLTH